jgi:hypothetical protein
MDARNCQTSTVAPAEPGVFPVVIKTGTLSSILKHIAAHHRMTVDELLKLLDL